MANKTISERNPHLDILKGIGIVSVVIGHAFDIEVAASPMASTLYNFLYVWHLPIFFFVAGYSFKDGYANAPKMFFVKKLRNLYLPYIGYCFVLQLIDCILNHATIFTL